MADWSSPLTSLDRGLSEANMSNCMVAGISGWCGMSCPVLCAGKCEEEEMIEAKRAEQGDGA